MRITDPEMLQCANACLVKGYSYAVYESICNHKMIQQYSEDSYNVLRQEMNSIVLKYTGSIL